MSWTSCLIVQNIKRISKVLILASQNTEFNNCDLLEVLYKGWKFLKLCYCHIEIWKSQVERSGRSYLKIKHQDRIECKKTFSLTLSTLKWISNYFSNVEQLLLMMLMWNMQSFWNRSSVSWANRAAEHEASGRVLFTHARRELIGLKPELFCFKNRGFSLSMPFLWWIENYV